MRLLLLFFYLFLISRLGVLVATVLAVAIVGVIYYFSLTSHPHTPGCGRCHGTGMQRHWFFRWARRPCLRCGGQPLSRRAGTRAISEGRPTWAERRASRARSRPGRVL